MADSADAVRIVIDRTAMDLAFKMGQAAERLILHRAYELAQAEAEPRGKAVVTTDHVRRAMSESSLQEACAEIHVDSDDDPKPRMVA